MEIPLYQVDAFTAELFRGNPAAVCPLDAWLPDERLQAIAAENNLSETAYLVATVDTDATAGSGDTGGSEGAATSGDRGRRGAPRYGLRWFTPVAEVELCGHATLASAHVVLERLAPGASEVEFESRSGPLTVRREGERYVLDFPAVPASPVERPPPSLLEGLGLGSKAVAVEVRAAPRDYLVVVGTEAEVRRLRPDLRCLEALDRPGVIVTAPGEGEVDFVSRFFAPALGVPEDPVTGSAHSTLVPYWAERTGRTRFHARQLSSRGGELLCEDRGDRVLIAGRAVLYLEGTVHLPD